MKAQAFTRSAVLVLVLAAAVLAQAPEPTTRPAGPVALAHMTVDPAAGRIVLSADVCLRSGPLELLVCRAGTKDYESVLRTEAPASQLHAALLMLGLSPGKPAEWVGQGEASRFLPPRGAELTVTLRWTDTAGRPHETAAGRWLRPAAGGKPPERWVFVGSEVLPDGGYWADVEGDVITVSNFASAVIDVPFESTTNNALLQFEADEESIPPVGTPVEVVIEPVAGAETADHARALLEIDRGGRLQIDGRPVSPEGLTAWAEAFYQRHDKPRVVIRPHPLALMWDVARARSELALGGIRDVELRYVSADAPALPRTPEQARARLRRWEEKFANPREFIREPAVEAETTLARIHREVEHLKARQSLWEEYAEHLRQALEAYKATTRPASDPGGPAPSD
jgi:hypothetical protein